MRARPILLLALLATVIGLAPSQPAAAFTCGEVDGRTRFVCATFVGFAGRQPTEADLDYWVPLMPAKRTFFAATVARSTEGRRLVVERYYNRFFETIATEADLQYWAPRVTQPNALRQLEAALLSDGSLSAEDFLDHAYGAQLGREPDAGEVAYWGDRIETVGQTKVAGEISNTLEARRARVRGIYINDLQYEPDEAGRAYWAQRLATGTSYFDVRLAIRSSVDAYPEVLGCTATAAPQFAFNCAV